MATSSVRVRSGQSQAILQLKANLSGPFFTLDVALRTSHNIRNMLEALAKEGEQAVKAEIGLHSRSGFTASGVVGRVHAIDGNPWWLHAVISQQNEFPWRNKGQRGFDGRTEAVYRGGRLEAKYHAFRRVTTALRASRAAIKANLTAGLE